MIWENGLRVEFKLRIGYIFKPNFALKSSDSLELELLAQYSNGFDYLVAEPVSRHNAECRFHLPPKSLHRTKDEFGRLNGWCKSYAKFK